MLNLVRQNELLVKQKMYQYNKIKKTSKHFPSSIREWNNSIYIFNKDNLNLIPYSKINSMSIIKSYFSLFNKSIENITRVQRLRIKYRRFSSNKIYVSNGEFKHTNNKIIINLYLFNREKTNYLIAIEKHKKKLNKKWRFLKKRWNFGINKGLLDIEKKLKRKIMINISNKKLLLLQKYFFLHINNKKINYFINLYIEKFLEKYVETTNNKLLLYWYYKQLLYINKLKYNYTYLQHLKEQLYRLFNKEIEFNLINLKQFFLNSDILSESITKKITRNRRKIRRYLKNLKNKVRVINKKRFLLNRYTINDKIKKNKLELKKNLAVDNKKLQKKVINNLKYKKITGFRLEAKGRLTKRNTASRSITKVEYKGNLLNIDSSLNGLSTVLLKGNLKSNIQYTKLISKSRIGSFGIKGWVSSN